MEERENSHFFNNRNIFMVECDGAHKKAPMRNAQTLFYILRLRANEQISLTSRENLATLRETC